MTVRLFAFATALVLSSAALAQDTRVLSGEVSYRERVALPPDAVLMVEVTAVDRSLIAEARIPTEGQQVPIPFEIKVPRRAKGTLRAGLSRGVRIEWLGEPVEVDAGMSDNIGELVLRRHQPMGFVSAFRCGDRVIREEFAGENTVLDTGSERLILARSPSASGARHETEDDPETWSWNKGDNALVSLAGEEVPECRITLPMDDTSYRAAAEPLPALNLDANATTVSGFSSGAFMAVQLQVAFSGAVSGAGIVAGGPYNCADHSLWRALYVCMNPLFADADPDRSVETMRDFAAENRIDPVQDIGTDRLYLFHGRADDTVARSTMDALRQTYEVLGMSETDKAYVTMVNAGHGFVSDRGTVSCDVTGPDFLIDCDFDQAGDILNQLYPDLAPPVDPKEATFVIFDQSAYAANAEGMDDIAFAYVPSSCAAGERCRLHIALHGCKQGREVMGEDYARLTGYNKWAEANGTVVLYPQAISIPRPWYNWFAGNPNGCWD